MPVGPDFESHLDLYDDATPETQIKHLTQRHGYGSKDDLPTNMSHVEFHYRDHATRHIGTHELAAGGVIGLAPSAVPLEEGGVTEAVPEDGMEVIVHDEEAVIPLDDPEAVEVMAEAIEEGGAGETDEATEAVAEAAEVVAEAAEEVAESAADVAESAAEIVEDVTEASEENVEEVADVAETVAEESADVVETEAAAETVQEAVSDVPPRPSHWSQRPLRLGRRR